MLSRRQFLVSLFASGVFYKTARYNALPLPATALTDKLAALFTQHDAIAALGNCYKTATNISTEISTLLSYLNLSEKQLIDMPNEALKQHLKTTIAQDFQRAQVETLDGWVLSKTELQLYHVLSRA